MAVWVLVACLVVLVVSFVFVRGFSFSKSRRCNIPGPRGLPYFGLNFFLTREPYKYFMQLSKKYGDVFCCNLGRSEVIILNTYEAIDDFFKKSGKVFCNRFIDLPDAVDIPLGFADLPYGDKHVELRNFAIRNLNKLNLGEKGTLEEFINDEIARFLTHIEKSCNNKPVHSADLIPNCIINILVQLVLGRPLGYDSPELKKLHHDALNVTITSNVSVLFREPKETKLIEMLGVYPDKLLKRSADGIVQICTKSHVEAESFLRRAKEGEAPMNCVLGNFLSTMKEKKAEGVQTFMSNNTMEGVLTNLLIGGVDTTSGLCEWIVLMLAKYQDMQTRLREEVLAKIGRDRVAVFADKNGMAYTNAFFQELLRFGSFSPLGGPHTTAEDTYHGDYFIPKGTYLLSNLWAANHDEAIFPNPNEFNPDRFLDDQGKFINDKHVITFGHGYRACPGKTFTMRQSFLLLVQLLQKFHLLPPEGVDPASIPIKGEYVSGLIAPDVEIRFVTINRE